MDENLHPRSDASTPRFRAAELDRHIGRRVRFLRRICCCSQREIGMRLGLTFQQVQKYENGVNRISAALLAELAGMFHLPLDWFIGPYSEGSPTRAGCYGSLLDLLFQHEFRNGEADSGAMLGTLCQLVRVVAPPSQRLAALRRSIAAASEADLTFLSEAARRIVEQACAPQDVPRYADAGSRQAPCGHVMLVDDDPDITTTLAASLTAAGFTVTTADGGDAALALLAAGTAPDVLVTDVAMVGMDGVELLMQVAQLEPHLPGLVITGFADSERLQDLPEAVEVLRKPFRRMELIGRLRLLLDRTRPAKAVPQAASV